MQTYQSTKGNYSPANSENQEAVTRTLAHALTLDDHYGWSAFTIVAAARLDDRTRAALSFSALRSQDHDDAELTASAAIDGTIHPTRPSYLDTPAGRRALIEWRESRDRRRAR